MADSTKKDPDLFDCVPRRKALNFKNCSKRYIQTQVGLLRRGSLPKPGHARFRSLGLQNEECLSRLEFDQQNQLMNSNAMRVGALNAVAGGGSFLTLPALVFAGVPPLAANATGTLALLPGYLSGAWALRDDMEKLRGFSLPILSIAS